MSNSHNFLGNFYEIAKQSFTTNLPKGNGFISSLDIAEQVANSLSTRSQSRALSLLVVGTNLEDLKNSVNQFANV